MVKIVISRGHEIEYLPPLPTEEFTAIACQQLRALSRDDILDISHEDVFWMECSLETSNSFNVEMHDFQNRVEFAGVVSGESLISAWSAISNGQPLKTILESLVADETG